MGLHLGLFLCIHLRCRNQTTVKCSKAPDPPIQPHGVDIVYFILPKLARQVVQITILASGASYYKSNVLCKCYVKEIIAKENRQREFSEGEYLIKKKLFYFIANRRYNTNSDVNIRLCKLVYISVTVKQTNQVNIFQHVRTQNVLE